MFIEKIILYAPLNYRRFALYVAKKLPPPPIFRGTQAQSLRILKLFALLSIDRT